jgi:hypothetical protein
MSLNYDVICHTYFNFIVTLMVKPESTLMRPGVNLRLAQGNACAALPPFQIAALLLYSPRAGT